MDQQESTIYNDIIEKKYQIKTFSFPKEEITTRTTAAANADHSKRRIAQNFLLIWADANIDQATEDCQNTLTQLRTIINDINIITQPDECIQFLNDIKDQKTFLIVSGALGQQLVPKIHGVSKLDSIYTFCDNKVWHEEWMKEWTKVKGVHTEIQSVCESLQLAIKQCNQDTIGMSFITADQASSDHSLDQLEPSFMYTQIFKEILLEMEHDEKSVQDLVLYCRKPYADKLNLKALSILDEFGRTYNSEKCIWWYTRPCFTYDMLNQALRTLDADTIINMGVFIRDLHKQLEQLHQQQIANYKGESFTLYRGQGLTTNDFDKLLKAKGGLMSFNNFLSTSEDRSVGLLFAESASADENKIGVLFKMVIDPSLSATPFAAIDDVSYIPGENEVLFSMHSVFRVGEIKKKDNKDRLYQVELKLTADDDPQLRTLTDTIRNETSGKTGWERLGHLLLQIGPLNKAEELYNALLDQTSEKDEQAFYYGQLGVVKQKQGDYENSIRNHEKTLEIRQATLLPDHPNLANSFNNIGIVYNNMGEYSKALEFYEKSHKIKEKALPSTHPDLAMSFNNIGIAYQDMGEYSKALEFYEKAHKIKEKALPPTHPDLAGSFICIGGVYRDMGEYSKALEFYEKSHKIYEKALPPTHPNLANSFNNIGIAYQDMGGYSKALEFYKKSHKILEKALSPTHPDLASSFNNIGLVYRDMGEYSEALKFFEESHKIYEKALPPTHPDLAMSFNNIGIAYQDMGEYSKALEFYEKAHKIKEKALSSTHPDLASSFNNIGRVFRDMGEYSEALEFFEKAHKIYEKALPPTHPDLAMSFNNIGIAYQDMGEYSKALEFYEKAHKIREKALPPNHPHLAISHLNFAACYEKMGDYTEALKALQNALQIQERTFEKGNHAFSSTYFQFGRVYRSMKEYSKALHYFQKCLAIGQKTLPAKHPYLGITHSDIGDVYRLQGDYEKALLFHQKALSIQENVQCDPLDCATTYVNLGETYREMNDYTTARTYYQKGMEIREKKLGKNHPDLGIIYHNLAKLYLATRQYSMAMKNVQQAIKIGEEKLPANHPHLVDYRETFEKIRKM